MTTGFGGFSRRYAAMNERNDDPSPSTAAMAQEIAASTQEMTASTEEVASTTGDLTERANQQALIVRGAADDASRILDISRELAAGAVEAAERLINIVI